MRRPRRELWQVMQTAPLPTPKAWNPALNGGVSPLILTVALVSEARGRFLHPAQLSDTLAELKRYGKTLIGSVVVRERRSPNAAPELMPSSVASRWNT